MPVILLSGPERTRYRPTHLLWTLNPFVLNITTRGSPEATIVLLVVLTLYCLRKSDHSVGVDKARWESLTAVTWALSISWKIYPVIYGVAIWAHLSKRHGLFGWPVWRFGLVALATFAAVNGVLWSMSVVLRLYHSAADGQMGSAVPGAHLPVPPQQKRPPTQLLRLLLSHLPILLPVPSDRRPRPVVPVRQGCTPIDPQSAVQLRAAVRPRRPSRLAVDPRGRCRTGRVRPDRHLRHLQQGLHVAGESRHVHHTCPRARAKVGGADSQYFVWFIPLLIPVLSRLHLSPLKSTVLVGAWIAAQALWLYMAFRLEFLGEAVHLSLWTAGLVLLATSTWIIGQMMDAFDRGSAGSVKRVVRTEVTISPTRRTLKAD